MKRFWIVALGASLVILPAVLLAQVMKTPPAEETAAMDTDMAGTDAAAKAAATEKLKGWVKGGYVSDHLWRNWVPALQKDGKNEDAAALCLDGFLHRPDPAAAYTLLTFRYQALTALGKNEDALAAAKSYFNVVQMTQTQRGLDAIIGLLPKVHPEDPAIVQKFRAEQADAAAGRPAPETSIMKSIKIDATIYEDALKEYKAKTDVRGKISYGDLLLAADKGEEAEKVFREVYTVATATDLTNAAEGIAKALRAQDGNAVRAAAWYKDIQASLATQAGTSPPATRATTRAASAPATKPKPKPVDLP